MTKALCYICSSSKFVDDHHYDCRGGELSPDTVALCRRCHQTYHIWGVEWFDDEYLDKAIEIENKRREIVYASLEKPVKPLQLLRRDEIRRSPYWYKKHGIKPPSHFPTKKAKAFPTFQLPQGEPLCGWQWVHEHTWDLLDWVPRIEVIGPSLKLRMDIDNKAKLRDAVKVLRSMKGR